MNTLTAEFIEECKARLLEAKSDVMNRVKSAKHELQNEEKGGDEGDQTVRALAEAEFLNKNERWRVQLVEIEKALSRIESGGYGVCEETEEEIEFDRLRAIPWTKLSIEGAEIRENIDKKFAK